jgi:hypothetical protein
LNTILNTTSLLGVPAMPPFSPASYAARNGTRVGASPVAQLPDQIRAQAFGGTSADETAPTTHSEKRLHANAEKAAEYEDAYDKLIAAGRYDKAASFLDDPVKLAYRNSHSWLTKMLYDLQNIDRETNRLRQAKDLSEEGRQLQLRELSGARAVLLSAADELDRLLIDIKLGISKPFY